MLWIGLAILGAVVLLLVFGLLLPVRIRVSVSGGTGRGFRFDGGIAPFGGLLGAGVFVVHGRYHLTGSVAGKRIFTANVQPLVNRFGTCRRERPPRKPKPEKPEPRKRTIMEQISHTVRNAGTYWGWVTALAGDIRRVIRFELVETDIRLGLRHPALLGKIIGGIAAFNAVLPPPFRITYSFTFSFETVQGRATIEATVFLHRLWATLVRRRGMIGEMRAALRTGDSGVEPDTTIAAATEEEEAEWTSATS